MIPTAQALADITNQLKQAGIEQPRREARLLLAFALGTNQAGVLACDEVNPAAYAQPLARRIAREPLAYITGCKEFWGLSFLTSPATLIPRPDSETLIEAALDSSLSPRKILDLGTGTGCLLLACLHEFPQAYGVGVDLNPEAVRLAGQNALKLHLNHRCAFWAGHWADALSADFDLILSNPPYIEQSEIPSLMPEVSRYEPKTALDGGANGLVAYQSIIATLPRILAKNGHAILELGIGQANSVAEIAQTHGFSISFRKDLSGVERAIILAFCK